MENQNKKPEILVVESNSHARAIIDILLSRSGYIIHNISDGQAALDYLKQNEPVNLVILDVDLPLVDGYTVVVTMLADKNWKDIPIVFMSSKATEKEIVHCFKLGASDYILKPFLPAEFVARISRLIQMAA
jgi:DNA-binding response OmpR family regulator